MLDAGPEVMARFQPLFAREQLAKITEQEFRTFLMFRNNRHWIGLQRLGPAICRDMRKLRNALSILLDEDYPIKQRLDRLEVGSKDAVPKLGRAVLTAILLVARPDRYGVWNSRSESAMQKLGLWPDLKRMKSFGARYERVNRTLGELSAELQCDLWTLDGLWWAAFATSPDAAAVDAEVGDHSADDPIGEQSFGLERHLHAFLQDNWDRTSLAADWAIHTEDGDEVGVEYQTSVGRIDVLARHRRENRWLVIELKRSQASDQTVGQVMRYMGWVKSNLAKRGGGVEGLIIARSGDEQIRYALEAVEHIRLLRYHVDFSLRSESGRP